MPPTGFRDYVEQIRAAANIADIVGDTVSLRPAGRSLVGLCPFHQEKTPSFHVDAAKGVYFCHGCKAGGDVFRFVSELHGLEFVEAAHWLAERYGIERPARSNSAASRSEDRLRRRSLEALADAERFFRAALEAAPGASARAYLERRGFDERARAEFHLGFAPDSWEALLRALTGRGYSVEELLAAGLVVQRREGNGVYDRFRDRVTFPIKDSAGRVVSFGGRALEGGEPKYLNGPETSVYDKSRTLFRLSEVAREIRQSGRAVLVEGYFDALSLSAAGVPGVVAVCGTSLGGAHARLLRRSAGRVVLFFDGDDAGRAAALKALRPLLEEGISPFVAVPPGGSDPDELARDRGAEAVESVLAEALDLPDFLVAEARRTHDLDTVEGRVSALEGILESLALLPKRLARAEAVDRVATTLGVEEGLLREELRRAAQERRQTIPRAVGAESRPGEFSPAEAILVRFLGGPHGASEEALELAERVPEQGLGTLARRLVQAWREARRAGRTLDLRALSELGSEEDGKEILALAFRSDEEPDPARARNAVVTVREKVLAERLRTVKQKLAAAGCETEELDRLQSEHFALTAELMSLQRGGAETAGAP